MTEIHGAGLHPFLKWAGGKRWLAKRLHKALSPLNGHRYIEPFLGSGAIYFYLAPREAVLTDLNDALISTYTAIRDNHRLVERHLLAHANHHSDSYYYEVRGSRPKGRYQKAARFIYLNRTCWNGLYRVNKAGIFNVPRGTKNSVNLTTDDFQGQSKLLKNATLMACDFEPVIDSAGKGDVIFADPPYTVKHNYNGFRKYNDNIFSWDDQLRLRNALSRARCRGAKIFHTNAAHKDIQEIYSGEFNIDTIDRTSVLASQAKHRGVYSELLITG